MELVKIHTPKPYYGWHSEYPATCKKPMLGRTYVRILATCVDYATTKDIYPGKKNIMPDQLYALERGGFLERFTKPEWASRNYGWPKTWWRTTTKGLEVVARAGRAR